MEWLLLFLTSTGHVNGHVDQLKVERFPTEQSCLLRAKELAKHHYYDEPRSVCFPVSALR